MEYDEQLRRCIIFEEDSFSQKDDLRTSTSPTHDLFDLICLDGGKSKEIIIIDNNNSRSKFCKLILSDHKIGKIEYSLLLLIIKIIFYNSKGSKELIYI